MGHRGQGRGGRTTRLFIEGRICRPAGELGTPSSGEAMGQGMVSESQRGRGGTRREGGDHWTVAPHELSRGGGGSGSCPAAGTPANGEHVIQGVFVGLVRGYQWVSRWGRRRCRFWPTCSEYTREALLQYGAARGVLLGMRRLARCHPWSAGGPDPVP